MDANGGDLKQLSEGKLEIAPVCSPDGKWAYFNDINGGAKLTRAPIDGGATEKMSDLPVVSRFDISSDGKTAAFATLQHIGEHTENLAVVSLENGATQKLLKFERPRQGAVRFTEDGKAVVYPVRMGDADNLWQQFLDASSGKQLTNFKSEHIGDSFGWSPDGKKLAIIRGHVDSDVVLIRDSK